MTAGTLLFIGGIAAAAAAVIATIAVILGNRKRKRKLDEYLKEWY